MRIEGQDVIGASLVVEDHPVHMELFRCTEPQRAQATRPASAEPQQPPRAEAPARDAGSPRKSWLRRIFS
jgi:hypothetical protein